MRLYSLVGADQHVDPEYGSFRPDEAGGFDFPDEISDVLGGFAVKGRKLWETEADRVGRLHGMEMARRRDPATMLAAMEDNAALTRKVTELMAMLTAAQLSQAAPAAAPEPAAGEAPPDASAEPEAEPGPRTQEEPRTAPVKAARTPKAASKPA